MSCTSCASGRRKQFVAEIAVHFSGLNNLDKPSVFVFPEILVCLECGFSQFTLTNPELTLLAEGAATDNTSIKKRNVDPRHFPSQDCA